MNPITSILLAVDKHFFGVLWDTPDDPHTADQWHLQTIEADELWKFLDQMHQREVFLRSMEI